MVESIININKREKIIYKYFSMWVNKSFKTIDDIFSSNIQYIESYGPKYEGIEKLKYWTEEWNKRGTVLSWDIKQFFHKDNQLIVEWKFECKMNKDKTNRLFDGISLIIFNKNNKIEFVKEYSCELNNYDPYIDSSFIQ